LAPVSAPAARPRFAPALAVIAALCLCLGATSGGAQSARIPANVPPDAPLHLIVPLAPGGTSDALARALADALRPRLGRVVLVENRPGASARIAVDALQRARPDGLTLLLAPIAVPVLLPLMLPGTAGDPARSMVPIAQVARFDYALAVAPGPHARSLSDFLAWLRVHPERAQFGTQGAGSIPHLLGVTLARDVGVELTHAAYNASGLLNADVANGSLVAAVNATSDLLPLHQAGRLRILATTAAQRSPTLPEVPTFAEHGWPSMTASGWVGVFAPAGTSKSVVDALADAVNAAMRDPAVIARLAPLGVERASSTPDELGTIIAADKRRWEPVLRASGFKLD
jgi:tripartite-type tricarboxylate transporter receptor subunit TctC